MRFTVAVINWGGISQAINWLPGAAVGGLVGGIGALLSWEDFASDACQVGTSQLVQACGDLVGYTFTSIGEFGAAGAAVGGLVGIGVNGLINAFGPEQPGT